MAEKEKQMQETERTRVWESKTDRDVSAGETSRYCYRMPKLPSVQETTAKLGGGGGAKTERTENATRWRSVNLALAYRTRVSRLRK